MPEKVVPGPVQDAACIREAVCIHTKKIFDSCREKDIASLNIEGAPSPWSNSKARRYFYPFLSVGSSRRSSTSFVTVPLPPSSW